MCVTESLCCTPEITQYYKSATLQFLKEQQTIDTAVNMDEPQNIMANERRQPDTKEYL